MGVFMGFGKPGLERLGVWTWVTGQGGKSISEPLEVLMGVFIFGLQRLGIWTWVPGQAGEAISEPLEV